MISNAPFETTRVTIATAPVLLLATFEGSALVIPRIYGNRARKVTDDSNAPFETPHSGDLRQPREDVTNDFERSVRNNARHEALRGPYEE